MINRTRLSRATLLLLACTLAGCPAHEHGEDVHEEAAHQGHAGAAWSYEGDTGPDHWGDLSEEYILAKTGKEQSPIDITAAQAGDLPAITFHYQPTSIDVIFNGHTVQQNEGGDNYIEVGGQKYTLAQLHFHSPSEHTIDGKHSDMEMHLVHKNDKGELAVVGVMIDAGDENAAFAPIWDNMPTAENDAIKADATVNADDLLPSDRAYYQYDGSLTTPPCSEGVLWLVMQSPVSLSQAQIDKFHGTINNNNRPVQPLNDRKITSSK